MTTPITEEEHEKICNQISRIEDMLIVLLSDNNFADDDLVNAAKKRLIKALILTD